jgi:hypothetical protein
MASAALFESSNATRMTRPGPAASADDSAGPRSFGVGCSKSFALHNATKAPIRVVLNPVSPTPRGQRPPVRPTFTPLLYTAPLHVPLHPSFTRSFTPLLYTFLYTPPLHAPLHPSFTRSFKRSFILLLNMLLDTPPLHALLHLSFTRTFTPLLYTFLYTSPLHAPLHLSFTRSFTPLLYTTAFVSESVPMYTGVSCDSECTAAETRQRAKIRLAAARQSKGGREGG